ncbi:hypothetical protein BDN67DRAFT_458 [Paxillus ammoniavirescens]|nr:hypothetical protein BDN67DRAFT_458 [Paxillus ammoniavirescens]
MARTVSRMVAHYVGWHWHGLQLVPLKIMTPGSRQAPQLLYYRGLVTKFYDSFCSMLLASASPTLAIITACFLSSHRRRSFSLVLVHKTYG